MLCTMLTHMYSYNPGIIEAGVYHQNVVLTAISLQFLWNISFSQLKKIHEVQRKRVYIYHHLCQVTLV